MSIDIVNAQPAAAYLAALRTGVSKTSMRYELNKVARLMGASSWERVNWATLNAANVMAVMAQVTGAPASRNKTLAALKGVAKVAWRLSMIDAETLARISDVHSDPGSRELAGRHLDSREIVALMRVCADDGSPAGARDAALIAMAHKTGARRAELAAIAMVDLAVGTDNTYADIRVIGKRNKERVLFVDDGSMQSLVDWLQVRGSAPGALFCAISQIGVIDPTHQITPTALHRILQKRAAAAGIENITWHDFRRTFAGSLLDAGEDIATVAALMGHTSSNITARYDRRPVEIRRRAARRIMTPYFGRAGVAA
ncbi:MAG: tyrosine-type recombinase/integrase [Chloroflexi bacterium]|nr:tyrosine-type recombinase/integrase [Chloroflexota bacterium]